MLTNGNWVGKWALRANVRLEERCTSSALKGYPKCPMPISYKCLQMGTGLNGDLRQMYIWGKGVPLGPFPQNFHKWALGENGHLDKGYPKSHNISVPISPQMFANGQWGK